MTRYWIGVACRAHVKTGEAGGFCQLGHGKEAPVRRLSPGDWITYYAPREELGAGVPVQAFVALGQVRAGDVYRAQQSESFCPFRRDVDYYDAVDAPIRPLLDQLEFIPDRASWGMPFRRGSFQVSRADFETIAHAMSVNVLSGLDD